MFKVKLVGTTNKTYTVKGTTLAEIWKDIEKRGPKVHGKNVAGVTATPVWIDGKASKMDFKFTPGKAGKGFDAELWHKSGTVSYEAKIKVPKLDSDKKLSAKAKSEWKRFISGVLSHEQEHVAVAKKVATTLGTEVEALKFKGSGADKKAALKDAVKTYKKIFTSKYSESKINERIDKAHKALDSKTGHGPTLKTSIP